MRLPRRGDRQAQGPVLRAAAELALVRVVQHYGSKPGFVLLGGLIPPLLCANSAFGHAGTTDVDVQVDLEIASGATHTARLERALADADFQPDNERVWRWQAHTGTGHKTEVKFELLADLADQHQGTIVTFNDCQQLGAVNLRGTGYAARDLQEHTLRAQDDTVTRQVQVNVSGLGGFGDGEGRRSQRQEQTQGLVRHRLGPAAQRHRSHRRRPRRHGGIRVGRRRSQNVAAGTAHQLCTPRGGAGTE